MRFRRPQVRYADAPQPVTPYQAAPRVWDERFLPAYRQGTGG